MAGLRPTVADRTPEELYRLNDVVKTYVDAVAGYRDRINGFVELVESALAPECNQMFLFQQFNEPIQKSYQSMPRSILDRRLLPLSSRDVTLFLNRILASASQAFKSCFIYYKAFVQDCLTQLEREVQTMDSEIVQAGLSHKISITRACIQCRQMVLDMAYRLQGYGSDVPLFDEFWVGVTEAHEEIRSVWTMIGVNRTATKLEQYLGYRLGEAWESTVRSHWFMRPHLLNEAD